MDFEGLQNVIQEATDNLNRRGSFDGVSKLPEIWQAVVDKEGDYL